MIFLDRDGVINVSPGEGFVTRRQDFRFLPGALSALRLLQKNGEKVAVVSNQSGVGRGFFSRSDLNSVTRFMLDRIRQFGGRIRGVYYCMHRPDAACACRKPKIGLIQKALRRSSVNREESFVIGDDERDIHMGKKAGCRTILVLSGNSSRQTAGHFTFGPDRIEKNLLGAVKWILKQDLQKKRTTLSFRSRH